MSPVPLGHHCHAAAGIVPLLNSNSIVKAFPQLAVTLLLRACGWHFKGNIIDDLCPVRTVHQCHSVSFVVNQKIFVSVAVGEVVGYQRYDFVFRLDNRSEVSVKIGKTYKLLHSVRFVRTMQNGFVQRVNRVVREHIFYRSADLKAFLQVFKDKQVFVLAKSQECNSHKFPHAWRNFFRNSLRYPCSPFRYGRNIQRVGQSKLFLRSPDYPKRSFPPDKALENAAEKSVEAAVVAVNYISPVKHFTVSSTVGRDGSSGNFAASGFSCSKNESCSNPPFLSKSLTVLADIS